MGPPKKSLYEILGVEPDANDLDIGLAFQRRNFELQRMAHPDPNAAVMVQQAHEILSNPKKRAAYDAGRVTASEKAAAEGVTPDLVIEGGEDEEPKRKWIAPVAAAAVAAIVAAFFIARSGPSPEKAAPPPVVEAPKPAPPPPPQPLNPAQLLATATRATGQLLSYDMSGTARPVGIAVSLEPSTVITTCHGVAAGSKVVWRQGAETLSAELTVDDEVLDLCRFDVPGLTAKTLAVASDDAKVGDKVYTLGMNAKGEYALTEGTVKQARMAQNVKLIELSTPVAPAASGGPVLDSFGRVVGIATTPHRFGPGIDAAIAAGWISQMRSRARPQ